MRAWVHGHACVCVCAGELWNPLCPLGFAEIELHPILPLPGPFFDRKLDNGMGRMRKEERKKIRIFVLYIPFALLSLLLTYILNCCNVFQSSRGRESNSFYISVQVGNEVYTHTLISKGSTSIHTVHLLSADMYVSSSRKEVLKELGLNSLYTKLTFI